MKTKNIGLAEKAQNVGGTLLEIKGSKNPLERKTYIFKETPQSLEKPLLEKYDLKKEDIAELVERPVVVANKKR